MKIIIVLSCKGVVKNETGYDVEGMLLGRLEKALKCYFLDASETYIIVTGRNSVCPDSCAMKQFLASKGIPAHKILEEEHAMNTIENAIYSMEMIKHLEKVKFIINGKYSESYMRDNLDDNDTEHTTFFNHIDRVTVITSKFHIPRTMAIFAYVCNRTKLEHITWEFLGTHKHHTYPEIQKRKLNENRYISTLIQSLAKYSLI